MSTQDLQPTLIVGFARTPFGKFGADKAGVALADLGAAAILSAANRLGAPVEETDEVIFGVNFPGIERTVARQVALKAGIPDDRPAYTVDRACCSSLTATTLGARSIAVGGSGLVAAGGVENLSDVPYVVPEMRFGSRLGDVRLADPLVISCPMTGIPRAVQAGAQAEEYGISRRAQDEWALRSHEKYCDALAVGAFESEMVPVTLPKSGGGELVLTKDECFRPGISMTKLASLPTVYGSATVTAGNAPNLSTGASCLILASEEKAQAHGFPILGRILATEQFAGNPQHIATIPGHTASRLLARAGVRLEDVHEIEINEAFAAVPLVSAQVLAKDDKALAASILDRTNGAGGALAIGHPTAATGARLVMSIVGRLRRRGGGVGLVTICGGMGEAEAALIEVETE